MTSESQKCARCGKNPPAENSIYCEECREAPPYATKPVEPGALKDLYRQLTDLRYQYAQLASSVQRREEGKGGQDLHTLLPAFAQALSQTDALLRWYLKTTDMYIGPMHQLDRLTEYDRLAGFMVGLCTLFFGALLQGLVDSGQKSDGAMWVLLLAAFVFGALGAYYHLRARKVEREIHTARQVAKEDLRE